jgi:transcriptional regulator with XRE-family HTH domain
MKQQRYHIKPYLKKRGFNLSYLAKQVGMTFQRFDHHIKEKDNLSMNLTRDLAEILGMKLETFIKEVEVKNPKKEDNEEFDNPSVFI